MATTRIIFMNSHAEQTVPKTPSITVPILCYNEEESIAKTVRGFQSALSSSKIYIYDNNSWDDTVAIAAGEGALVRLQGKGHVFRRMFADVDADAYVLGRVLINRIPLSTSL